MHESIGYGLWATKRMYVLSAAGVITTNFLQSFLDFPPRQTPGSFSVDGIISKLEAAFGLACHRFGAPSARPGA
jgi:arylsulfatase